MEQSSLVMAGAVWGAAETLQDLRAQKVPARRRMLNSGRMVEWKSSGETREPASERKTKRRMEEGSEIRHGRSKAGLRVWPAGVGITGKCCVDGSSISA